MTAPVRLQSRGMRALLLASGALVLLAGIQLFVFAERTDEYFSWTIAPPVTAAFLGAGYFAAVAMEWLAARHAVWVAARLVAMTIIVFASLTTVATLVHIDRFHLDGPTVGTVAVTWVWIVIYVVVPPAMIVLALLQRRAPGADPQRQAPVPGWFKVVFGGHALVMLAIGIPLFLWPVLTATTMWPWELTPLTGRAVGAWLIGMGFGGLLGMWENDWSRLYPMAVSFFLLTVLQLVTVLRYLDAFDWSAARSWLYLVYLVNMFALSVVAWHASHRAPRLRELVLT